MNSVPLYVTQTVTLDSSGKGTIVVQPNRYGQDWDVERITVSCNSAEETRFDMYRDFEQDSSRIGGSYSGNNDTDSTANLKLRYGNRLICVWSNGTAGDIATVFVEGKAVGR